MFDLGGWEMVSQQREFGSSKPDIKIFAKTNYYKLLLSILIFESYFPFEKRTIKCICPLENWAQTLCRTIFAFHDWNCRHSGFVFVH